ncbi:MAG TPA: class I SAM-dependent methyltransferase [Ktedonobacteraceae bacterium]|nr:class I SAM-dependent methyltransferase [Ktedonobacteraceae bacterium]
MPPHPHSRDETPSTYFVGDRSNKDELTRLTIQEQMVTTSMGGVLPEQTNTSGLRRILDVACGPGGWLISVAKEYPAISQLVGVDISPKMIAYAQKQAQAEKVSDRVQFLVMDVQHPLPFPDDQFDLVNQRSATSFLRTWDWSKLLPEFLRITHPGGIVRLTEPDMMPVSNTPAFTRHVDLLVEAFYQSGHLFAANRQSVPDALPGLLHRFGLQNMQQRDIPVEYRSGTPEGQLAFENTRIGIRTALPFLRKWTKIPNDYEELGERALSEMQQPDFVATWNIHTIWGNAPEHSSSPTRMR